MRDLRVSFPKPCDEPWEAMAPAGCDRICARCDKVIHDLSQLSFDQAEALLRRDTETCVRAQIDANGMVALKSGGGIRRMMVAVGASALLSASAPAVAQQRHLPAISGKIEIYFVGRVRVTATGADGSVFRGKVRQSGRYWFKHLPPGTYTLTFNPDCGEDWTVENVVVRDDQPVVLDTRNENGCITIGQVRIDDRNG